MPGILWHQLWFGLCCSIRDEIAQAHFETTALLLQVQSEVMTPLDRSTLSFSGWGGVHTWAISVRRRVIKYKNRSSFHVTALSRVRSNSLPLASYYLYSLPIVSLYVNSILCTFIGQLSLSYGYVLLWCNMSPLEGRYKIHRVSRTAVQEKSLVPRQSWLHSFLHLTRSPPASTITVLGDDRQLKQLLIWN